MGLKHEKGDLKKQEGKRPVKQVDVPDGFQQGRFSRHCRRVIYPGKVVQIRHLAGNEKRQHGCYISTFTQSAVQVSPNVVIHAGGENSVPRTRREISTGYAQTVAMQLRDGLAFGLLQTSAVINTHYTAGKNKIFI